MGPAGGGEPVQGSVEFVSDDRQGPPGFLGGQGIGSNEGEQRPGSLHPGSNSSVPVGASGKPSCPESMQPGKGNGWFPWLFLDPRLAIRYVITYPYL
jgi:hypothetical protein